MTVKYSASNVAGFGNGTQNKRHELKFTESVLSAVSMKREAALIGVSKMSWKHRKK